MIRLFGADVIAVFFVRVCTPSFVSGSNSVKNSVSFFQLGQEKCCLYAPLFDKVNCILC